MRQDISPSRMIKSLERLAEEGGLATIVIHKIVDDNPVSNQYSLNQFTAVVEKIAELRDSGQVEILTMEEYRNLMFGTLVDDNDNNDENNNNNSNNSNGNDNNDENDDINNDDVTSAQDTYECYDWDGDGWGWDGEKGCRMSDYENNSNDNNEDSNNDDNDEDENGSNNDDSNEHNDNNENITETNGTYECYDWDGDGWGWDGEKGCKM